MVSAILRRSVGRRWDRVSPQWEFHGKSPPARLLTPTPSHGRPLRKCDFVGHTRSVISVTHVHRRKLLVSSSTPRRLSTPLPPPLRYRSRHELRHAHCFEHSVGCFEPSPASGDAASTARPWKRADYFARPRDLACVHQLPLPACCICPGVCGRPCGGMVFTRCL